MSIKPGTKRWSKVEAKRRNNKKSKYVLHWFDATRPEHLQWTPVLHQTQNGKRVYYTSYPLNNYDEASRSTGVNPIHVLSYDYDKRCIVKCLKSGNTRSVKTGYIYTGPVNEDVAYHKDMVISLEDLHLLPATD